NTVVSPNQKFYYDALYRLTKASGRELKGTAAFGADDNWKDAAWQTSYKGDGAAVQTYTQQYSYDRMGNILELQHIAGVGSYTRAYTYASSSNQLTETAAGTYGSPYPYSYDDRG